MSAVMELKKKELIRLKSQSSYDTTYSVATTTSTDGDNLSSDGFGSRASNSSSDCSTTPRKWRRVSIKRPTTEAHNDTASSSSFAEYEDDDEDYESDESFPDDLDSDYGKIQTNNQSNRAKLESLSRQVWQSNSERKRGSGQKLYTHWNRRESCVRSRAELFFLTSGLSNGPVRDCQVII